MLKAIKGCDYVFHFAAVLGVSFSNKRALECLDVNILGTRNVLDACIRERVKKIVFSSSSEVYGEPIKLPISETHTLQPKSEYGVSKLVGEEYVKAFAKEFGLNYTIIRFFNVYGPNQSAKFVMPLFIDDAILNRPLRIYGDGSQIRSFCHVEDAVKGIELAMFKKAADKQIFNIGNKNQAVSIKDLAIKVNRIAGNKQKPVFIPLKSSDRTKDREIYKRKPSTLKAEKLLGFKPTITLTEGIQKVVKYRKSLKVNLNLEPSKEFEI